MKIYTLLDGGSIIISKYIDGNDYWCDNRTSEWYKGQYNDCSNIVLDEHLIKDLEFAVYVFNNTK